MESTERILVRTYGLMVEADLAAGQLRAQGIECEITTDDCAGMYPSMGVIQLLVDPADAEDARRILRESAQLPVAALNVPEMKTPAPSRALSFNLVLLAGIVVGVLIHISYSRLWELRDLNPRYDDDGDGVPDREQIWRRGELKEERLDRNRDGRPDNWLQYSNGWLFLTELDDNFDGKADSSYSYSKRQLAVSSIHDTDFNGAPDLTVTYTNGFWLRADWRINGAKVVTLRQLYLDGWVNEELRDQNGDGLFDVSILFDRFSTPIRTNSLRPTSSAP
jgi:hypothetical protein